MILTVDIGNTNITIGGFDHNQIVLSARFATIKHRTADQHAIELKNLLELNGRNMDCVEGAVISSVVPVVSSAMKAGLEKYFKITPVVIGPSIKTGLDIKIDNPAQLGADLVAGAVGAINKYPLPCVVFDLGTAMTASVISADGVFLGGTISAGLRMSLDAMASNTAALPHIDIVAPKSVIGKNTVESMRAGLVIGSAATIDGLSDRIEEELGQKITVVATGGNAKGVIEHCKRHIIYDENLLLDGLLTIYKKNIKN